MAVAATPAARWAVAGGDVRAPGPTPTAAALPGPMETSPLVPTAAAAAVHTPCRGAAWGSSVFSAAAV